MLINIATWNIAGARPVRSEGVFDYGAEDVDYFTQQLKALELDIICLQETHLNKKRSVATEIAEKLGGHDVHENELSPSHIDREYSLGNAILYKREPTSINNFLFPYPSFPLYLPGNKPALHHDKGFQIAAFEFGEVVNLQMMPLRFLGTPYDSENGKLFAKEMESILLAQVAHPSILCGDFNFADPTMLYDELLADMADALPDVPTRPQGKKTDFIFYSHEFVMKDSGVIETDSDHFLCWATLETK